MAIRRGTQKTFKRVKSEIRNQRSGIRDRSSDIKGEGEGKKYVEI